MYAGAPEWLTAVGFTTLSSKATLLSQKGLPQTCPSVCLLLPFAEVPTGTKSLVLPTELVEPENFSSSSSSHVVLEEGSGHLHYLVVPQVVVVATALATEKRMPVMIFSLTVRSASMACGPI
jgi:hypothetical protein